MFRLRGRGSTVVGLEKGCSVSTAGGEEEVVAFCVVLDLPEVIHYRPSHHKVWQDHDEPHAQKCQMAASSGDVRRVALNAP